MLFRQKYSNCKRSNKALDAQWFCRYLMSLVQSNSTVDKNICEDAISVILKLDKDVSLYLNQSMVSYGIFKRRRIFYEN